ncbi:Universal stress protein G [Roseovarius gaetbuli]|uniref:Universal stress protein G n=1 Tax=Roseovarius gaetbuli TaxID=1356575 RepID=A0A1X7A2Y4_9RHOB|nr:universal stress protein [Roseovarius gaetbuli]SLN68725.1 Universal stress protein G [Roseovarius gaetbuli]
MFSTIMVPVDLVHKDTLSKALDAAGDMAKRYGAVIKVVSVGGELPNELGHNSGEFTETVQDFAKGLRDKFGVEVEAETIISHDPEVETTSALMKAIESTGADLVIMASHVPGILEHIFSSHGGYIAQHAKVSVFIIR